MKLLPLVLSASLCLAAGAAQALQISRFTPQGEVAQLGQVRVQFDSAAVRMGDAQARAPVRIHCSDAQASDGQGHWNNEREWVFSFAAELPPGVQCTAAPVLGFKSPSGAILKSVNSYKFNSGGPFVKSLRPYSGEDIDEEQFFVLELSGAATAQSLQEHLWCAGADLGERVGVRLIDGQARSDLLKGLGLDKRANKAPQQWVTLACTRRLTAGAQMQLVFDAGVRTPSGIETREAQRFDFTVRQPFRADFSCERENAQAACLPIRPLRLSFNAPITRKQALGIRLKSAQETIKPLLDGVADTQPAAWQDGNALVHSVEFPAPLTLRSQYQLELPKDFRDAAGRPLAHAADFPMTVATGDLPPLAKFAAAPFGIVERFAEGPAPTRPTALLPVTLRKVEADLPLQTLTLPSAPEAQTPAATSTKPAKPAKPAKASQAAKVSTVKVQEDADIIAWLLRVQQYDDFWVDRKQAQRDSATGLPAALPDQPEWQAGQVESRTLSLLAGREGVKTLDIPKTTTATTTTASPRPFEVVGIPLPVGFHVVEIASSLLGQSLLDERYGSTRAMYVRTTALVTNLAVHFKLGRENSLAWVTSLDKGQSIAGAQVRVSDCSGKTVAQGQTDAQGLVRFEGLSPEPPQCKGDNQWRRAYFVSARAVNEGEPDMAFTWSDWQRGIEPWRFNLPTSTDTAPDQIAHTILDRPLLRAGETVSMKHLLRTLTASGFGLPQKPPPTLAITHIGSGQRYTQALQWRRTPTGGLSASSEWPIPPNAPLGQYQITLQGKGSSATDDGGSNGNDGGDDSGYASAQISGQFRVEEFRLPILQGSIGPSDKQPLVRPRTLRTDVQVDYVSGGPAAHLPVRVSALVRPKTLDYSVFENFSFSPPRPREAQGAQMPANDEGEDGDGVGDEPARIVADKLPVTLDKNGSARLTIDKLPIQGRAQELLLEARYADPNGEIQTLRSTHTLWPAAVVAAIKAEDSASSNTRLRWQALAITPQGQPQAGVALSVQAIAHSTTSTRKRMVGGFYSYDNQSHRKDLGTLCTGSSDGRGLLLCEAQIDEPGEIELVVTARDKAGNEAQASTSVWIARKGELWFGGQDHDRIDLLPEKTHYAPGETAVFQVRMPFRFAKALVTVEREGIVHSQVVELEGKDPTLRLPVGADWGPNVYVSALVLRGRLRDVPWYSFFTWGYKAPRQWWGAFWYEGKEYIAPTTLVDLSKPAYRLGVAEIRVGAQAHTLAVTVQADQESYPVRGQAQVLITAKRPDGQPAAGAEVALAAVDHALLELLPNRSWNVLDAMWARRSWGVSTATAQMEIIGRRHYGKKATPAGGGGGRAPTRQLLDTLLLWRPAITLDAQGQARVIVPLNDALSRFDIVAVADMGAGLFGSGQTSVRTAQDLQILSGLPPLVREGDRFGAQVTLRNTTTAPMQVQVKAKAPLLSASLPVQTVDIAPGEAQTVVWDVSAPVQTGPERASKLTWEIEARAQGKGGARDALQVQQRLIEAIPLQVQQATLRLLDGPQQWDMALPAEALPGRGGVKIALQPQLSQGLPGVRDWWASYPFVCLEQKASKAMGLGDAAQWQTIVAQLPQYLDADGLAYYFPPRDGQMHQGSDTLSAYLLASAHQASRLHPRFALPDADRASLENGLIAFVEGRIERNPWSPRPDLALRKLAAIEALSRTGRAQARMLQSIAIAPEQWPTHALIDWLSILGRMPDIAGRDKHLAQAQQLLRSRLSASGTGMDFTQGDGDDGWWLMRNGDTNAARLLLAVLTDPAWKDDLPRLAQGLIARQRQGAWSTSAANLWGAMALEQFAAAHEIGTVKGRTRAQLGSASAEVNWAQVTARKPGQAIAADTAPAFGAAPAFSALKNNQMLLPWGDGATPQTLQITHQGSGAPWVTVQTLAAVARKSAVDTGLRLRKTMTPLDAAPPGLPPGDYARASLWRVTLHIHSAQELSWVAITDPIAAGASILGSGLGRDSDIATQGEKHQGWGQLAFEERGFDALRSYYSHLPKGETTLQYTIRMNTAGHFQLPPTRAQALYAPEIYGELPNAAITVKAP